MLCVLENILTEHEATLIDAGSSGEVIDARVAFQTDTEDEFTEAIERLTQRRVVAFMSANQTRPASRPYCSCSTPPLPTPRRRPDSERAERHRGLGRDQRRAGHGRGQSRLDERD